MSKNIVNYIYNSFSQIGNKKRESTLTYIEKLNRIDDMRNKLLQFKKEQSFDEIFSSFPQFIVIGPQSSGKSSVLQRITGISLPTSSGVCTRVPTVIKLRRGQKSATVDLIHPNGTKQNFENSNTMDNVPRAIIQAQKQFKDRGEFGKDFYIEVFIQDLEKPNITLVDLPGFTNSSDENTVIVNDMVKKYLDMNGTLILHVARADQDYDSLLGNDFIRKHSTERVLVLTHCDKLEDEGVKNYTQRLDETLEKQTDNINVFAMIASKSLEEMSHDDEVSYLQRLNSINSRERIRLGTKNLYEFIEKRMEQHLDAQIPFLRDQIQKMKNELDEKRKEYDKDPTQVLLETLKILRSEFKGKIENYQVQFRQEIEDLKTKITDIDIFTNNGGNKEQEFLRKIKECAQSRKLINIGNMNKQEFVEEYMTLFADEYRKVLINVRDRIYGAIKVILEEPFIGDFSPLATEFVKKLKRDLFAEYNGKDSMIAIEHLHMHNCPPLVFALNEVYLNNIYREMTKDKQFAGEDSIYEEIIYRIKAQIKYAKLTIIEAAYKEFYISLVKNSQDCFEFVLNKSHENKELVKMPDKMMAEKEKYDRQHDVIFGVLLQVNEM